MAFIQMGNILTRGISFGMLRLREGYHPIYTRCPAGRNKQYVVLMIEKNPPAHRHLRNAEKYGGGAITYWIWQIISDVTEDAKINISSMYPAV